MLVSGNVLRAAYLVESLLGQNGGLSETIPSMAPVTFSLQMAAKLQWVVTNAVVRTVGRC